MAEDPNGPQETMTPLLDMVVDHVPEPTVEPGEFKMLATTIESNPLPGPDFDGSDCIWFHQAQ